MGSFLGPTLANLFLVNYKSNRNNNALETYILCKPSFTFSSVRINFNSFLPKEEYKRGFLHTLLSTTYNICSYYLEIHEKINNLKSV